MSLSEEGYVNYFEILGVDEAAKPGDVRKEYRRRMKDLVAEIARVEITAERRAHYLLEMAKLNAALYVLRDAELRDTYWESRRQLIALEEEWRTACAEGADRSDALRRQYDGKIRDFLGKYIEEAMLAAGRDKEVVENSHWDEAHERHASRILRYYRQNLYQQILERLPFSEVTTPCIEWDERARTVSELLAAAP
ncbi:MAG TPA: hypothetical protein PLO62_11660 [Candidatus Hydrogenedentes bacterium]|nr:hypothetical protein [Candidatus Hydrogenedentota bacterium]HOS02217.1 hypothetical protein [Candidatus Hydrogenedentota bacterium]